MLLITRHLHIMRAVAADCVTYVALRRYFSVPGGVPLLDYLAEWGYDQADVVLGLLRVNTPASLRFAERIIGRPIVRCPPCLRRYNEAAPTQPRLRITAVVAKNPRVEPEARARFEEFRVGRTVEQLLTRGIRQREISWLRKNGWVTMELTA